MQHPIHPAALPSDPVSCPRPRNRARIEVVGPDAADFLQRLSSQDIAGLEPGAAAPGAFLDPKGKLIAAAWIGRAPVADAERYIVLVVAEAEARLAEMLERYHFTEKLAISRFHDRDEVVELVGAGACAAVGVEHGALVTPDPETVVFGVERFGIQRAVALGPAAGITPFRAGTDAEDGGWFDVYRVLQGDLKPDVDAEARTLGLEAFLDDHVSTTKGCYTGQEIVARIHTYGHVNRRLVLLRIDGLGAIDTGTQLCETDDGDPVGRVTSAVDVPGAEHRLALGYVPNAFVEPGTQLRLESVEGPVVVTCDFGSQAG